MADTRKLSTVEVLDARMLNFDPEYQRSLYRQAAYAIGEKHRNTPGFQDGSFPVFPDMQPKFLQTGTSRRILNTQFIGMARTMYAEPEPTFPQVDKYIGEARKQWYLSRHQEGAWGDIYSSAFLDGEGTGVGVIQVGMAYDIDSGMPKVDIQHIHSYNFVYDRHQRSPNQAAWAYSVHYMDVDVAIATYGKSAKDHVSVLESGTEGRAHQCVRVFEYSDKGVAGKNPTYCVRLGQLTTPPIIHEANPFGACLPWGFMVYFLPPGMRRPMGRIAFQMSTQESLNDIEAYLRKQLKQPDFTLIDAQAMDPQDLQKVIAGNIPAYVRITKPLVSGMSAPAIRVPSAGVAQAIVALQDIAERQFTTDSGVTEHERGQFSDSKRTLGENQLVDERGGVQASWSELKAAEMYRDVIRKVFHIGVLVDRAPTQVDIFGRNYIINNPAEPASMIDAVCEEPSVILIDEQTLRRTDATKQGAERLAALSQIEPYVGNGIDPVWFIEEKLKAIGEKDPREAMGAGEQGALGVAPLANTNSLGAPAPMDGANAIDPSQEAVQAA